MADDMSNTNDARRTYTDAITAQLGERVTNLGRRQTDLETEVRSGFKNINTAVTSLANETRASIVVLSTNLAERNKPQRQALGVALTFAAMLDGLAYLPTSDQRPEAVSWHPGRQDGDAAGGGVEDREIEDRARTDASVKELRDAQMPDFLSRSQNVSVAPTSAVYRWCTPAPSQKMVRSEDVAKAHRGVGDEPLGQHRNGRPSLQQTGGQNVTPAQEMVGSPPAAKIQPPPVQSARSSL
jgi:hypothetical protein